MKAYYLLAPLSVAVVLGGCTVVRPVAVTTPAPTVAYVSPTYVSPTYVAPYTIVAP